MAKSSDIFRNLCRRERQCNMHGHEPELLGTDVSPFPNFNNSVLTTRRNLLLHC